VLSFVGCGASDPSYTSLPVSPAPNSPTADTTSDPAASDTPETDPSAQADPADEPTEEVSVRNPGDEGEFTEQATKPKKDLPPLVQGPQGVYTVTFQDLELDMEAATVYDEEEMMNDRVRQLEGQKIKIKGYIHGGTTFTQSDIKQFLMVRNAECPFGGEEGVACHNIRITLEKGVDFTVKPITIQGVLKISPWTGPDEKTWSIYTLKGNVE